MSQTLLEKCPSALGGTGTVGCLSIIGGAVESMSLCPKMVLKECPLALILKVRTEECLFVHAVHQSKEERQWLQDFFLIRKQQINPTGKRKIPMQMPQSVKSEYTTPTCGTRRQEIVSD